MSKITAGNAEVTVERLIHTVSERLSANKRVRRTLPGWGRLHVDRQVPFLCVYRRPAKDGDLGTERLVTSEASYLIATGARSFQASLSRLVEATCGTLASRFGAFLVVEVWSAENPQRAEAPGHKPTMLCNPPPVGARSVGGATGQPRFRIVASRGGGFDSLLEQFEAALSRISVAKQAAAVEVTRRAKCCPAHVAPILSPAIADELRCTLLGLEVAPIYRDQTGNELYPFVLRDLRRGLSRALRRTFYEFSRTRTTHQPEHFHMLGRRAVVKAVWEVDRRLAEVAGRFDFLLQATPTNAHQALLDFRKSNFRRAPRLEYRPLPVDPLILKRRLYETPVERVEDPTLAQLFLEKLGELDRQITMLTEINQATFVHSSLQLYGEIDESLVALADQVLQRLPSQSRDDSKGGFCDAATVARLARVEIESYRRTWPGVQAPIELRDDIASGLMCTRGSLLVDRRARIPATRADALLQHEVGTHLLTYYNGRAQPLEQLYCGLAGCEALQEGLAVLAEYLVGGLSRSRLRLLAARVLATRRMIDGASFVETFRELHDAHGFDQGVAFSTTLRVFRGGGLTKDASYLAGLCQVLHYLSKGEAPEVLWVGKIGIAHVALVRELQYRGVLKEPPLRPNYLSRPEAIARLERVRQGISVLDLIDGR